MFALVALLAVLHLTAPDNGRTFTVKPQAPIVVTLVSNASTGYHWKLGAPLDRSVLRLVSRRYTAPKSGLPGAAGKETWRFSAVGRGSDHLRLVYVPPGRSGKTGAHFGATIRVG